MNVMRTLLVIGKDRDAIASKYDIYREPDEYPEVAISLAGEMRRKDIEDAESIAADEEADEESRNMAKFAVRNLNAISDVEYFRNLTETGRAFTESTRNTDGKYAYPACYQERFAETGEEAPLSEPFTLKDGTQSYVSSVDEIDWAEMHGSHREVYETAWELCVEGRKPENIREEGIVERMKNRDEYFSSFADKEEYVRHSTSFFTYAVATEDGCHVPEEGKEKEWVAGFYGRFIEPIIGTGEILSIYDISVPD